MRVGIVIPFLDEERFLPEVLDAVAGQTRLPDALLLIDDGSRDGSAEIAAGFAAKHPFASLHRRPRRPVLSDRMVHAHELRAFQWALERMPLDWDVAAKLDADVRLTPDALAEMERRLVSDPELGIAGTYLRQLEADGRTVPHRCPEGHVEGATKFYRRACWDDISPVPPILGWDTLDEVRARMRGWRTQSFSVPSGSPLHLRRTASHDGVLRGFRRMGLAAYAYGAHPAHVLAATAARLGDRPRGLCALNYLAGWALAAVRPVPRAEPEARAFVRRENLRRLRGMLAGGLHA
jgi:hypothetical protein